jgi:hypothetical protein
MLISLLSLLPEKGMEVGLVVGLVVGEQGKKDRQGNVKQRLLGLLFLPATVVSDVPASSQTVP